MHSYDYSSSDQSGGGGREVSRQEIPPDIIPIGQNQSSCHGPPNKPLPDGRGVPDGSGKMTLHYCILSTNLAFI